MLRVLKILHWCRWLLLLAAIGPNGWLVELSLLAPENLLRPGALLCLQSSGPEIAVETVSGPEWKRHTLDSTSQGADGVKLGDINRDGLMDIATGWEEGGEVRVYLNPGPPGARFPWPRVTVGKVRNPEDAIFADPDGDGQLDVVSCTEGATRTVFWHRFTGESEELLQSERWTTQPFPATAKKQMWMQAISLDLDKQHTDEIVLSSKNEDATIGWLQAPKHSADLMAWQYFPLRTAGWIMSLISCDMDGNGDIDILYTDRKGPQSGVFWLENPGPSANRQHQNWTEHRIGGQGREVMFADRADIDGDQLQDVIVAIKPCEIIIFFRQQNDGWQPQTLQLNPNNLGDAKAVKATDVNGDGLTDLFFTCENAHGPREGIIWLEQQQNGPWQQHTLGGAEGVKFDLMQLVDMDNDGDPDVLTCEERDNLGVIWYENPYGNGRLNSLPRQ